MSWAPEMKSNGLSIVAEHPSNGAVLHLNEHQRRVLLAVIRDSWLAIPQPTGNDPSLTKHYVATVLNRAGILDQEGHHFVSVWGSGSPDTSAVGGLTEEQYAAELSYVDGLQGRMIGTGSGPGIMKAAFGKVQEGYRDRLGGPLDLPRVGFTERFLMSREIPNELVTDLIVMPEIYTRMEAFLRRSDRIRVLPGGVGTLQELFLALSVALDPKNAGAIPHGFLEVLERPGGQFIPELQHFLSTCFREDLRQVLSFDQVSARDYAQMAPDRFRSGSLEGNWNNHLVISSDLHRDHADASEMFDRLEGLEFAPVEDPFLMAMMIYGLWSDLVDITARDVGVLEAWQEAGQWPELQGDTRMLQAFEHFYRWMGQRLVRKVMPFRMPYWKD